MPTCATRIRQATSQSLLPAEGRLLLAGGNAFLAQATPSQQTVKIRSEVTPDPKRQPRPNVFNAAINPGIIESRQ